MPREGTDALLSTWTNCRELFDSFPVAKNIFCSGLSLVLLAVLLPVVVCTCTCAISITF